MRLELTYIWVEKFRNFKNAGFNFSSDLKFSFDRDNKLLTCEKVDPLPVEFFGYQISEVTGLIGKNGSGKTNILELVCKILKGGKSTVNSPFILITYADGVYNCYVHKIGFKPPLKLPNFHFISYDRKIDPLKVVYFSNVFDGRVHGFDSDVSDISSNYRYPRERYPYNYNRKKSDFEKQLEFIESPHFKELDIEYPTEVRIVSKLFNRRFTSSKGLSGDRSQFDINYFIQSFSGRFSDILVERRLYYSGVLSLLKTVLRILDRTTSSYGEFIPFFEDLKGLDRRLNSKGSKTESIIEGVLDSIKDVIPFIYPDGKKLKERESIERDFTNLLQLRENIMSLNVELVIEGKGTSKNETFLIQYKPYDKKTLNTLISLFTNSDFNTNWTGISSGHKAYLNIFSLLYTELKGIRRQNTLICIDEGDLYLHPKWQIEFFAKLLKVLPEIYKGYIQLILTSHSPFLISDLPKQNITIVDENAENGTLDGIKLDHETFAGNLYELYSEPFFLGDNRTSVFARNRINDLLERLNNLPDGLSGVSRTELAKEIQLIGDDVIRLHLLKKLEND